MYIYNFFIQCKKKLNNHQCKSGESESRKNVKTVTKYFGINAHL